MVAQEGDKTLGRRAGSELLEMVVASMVREIHNAFHDERVEAPTAVHVGECAERRRLHLQPKTLPHMLGYEAPDIGILDHSVAAAHRGDVQPEGQDIPSWR